MSDPSDRPSAPSSPSSRAEALTAEERRWAALARARAHEGSDRSFAQGKAAETAPLVRRARRRASHREGDDDGGNAERWLLSYADFITLLFAFFVVTYSISSINQGKYQQVSDALSSAFVGEPPPGALRASSVVAASVPSLPLASPQRRSAVDDPRQAAVKRERARMQGLGRELLQALAPLAKDGRVRITQTPRGVSVEISASVLFGSGDAELAPASVQALSAVAQVLRNEPNAIQVEGHTDDVPIANGRFPSNWELSAVRAAAVIRLFVASGIAETRLLAVGHAANQPVAANGSSEGRLRNRRVTLMILSALPERITDVPLQDTAR